MVEGVRVLSFVIGGLAAGVVAGKALAAEPQAFVLEPAQSEIHFTATQNGAEVKGEFTSFTAPVLQFHPDALADSKVVVEVALGSVSMSYDEAVSTLQTPEWFNVDAFPTARFETTAFSATDEGSYLAEAILRIKGKTVPVRLTFDINRFDEVGADVTGRTVLKRTDFGIGWDATDTVADAVPVTIHFTAKRAE